MGTQEPMEPMQKKATDRYIDLCVAHKSKCLFTKSLKTEVIFIFLSNTKNNFVKKRTFGKYVISFVNSWES